VSKVVTKLFGPVTKEEMARAFFGENITWVKDIVKKVKKVKK